MRKWIHDVRLCLAALVLSAAALPAALGQIDVGSNGFDGAFNPTEDVEIDLSQATPGAWNAATGIPGNGVYDANVWAIVFRWTSVNIPADVTVTFKNHPANPPVVWLSQTDITIAGQVILDGAQGHAANAVPSFARPGPGGFAGGSGKALGESTSSAGFGPGGGQVVNGCVEGGGGGGFGSVGGSVAHCGGGGSTYGGVTLVPLMGGSGGGANSYQGWTSGGGGGGGGAILVASNQAVTIEPTGLITARGGRGGSRGPSNLAWGGGGAGGAVRIVADEVVLSAGAIPSIDCRGGITDSSANGNGGVGRIRIEGNTIGDLETVVPPPSTAAPQQIFPTTATPSVRILSINGAGVPAVPSGGFFYPFIDLLGQRFPTNTAVLVQCRNVPITSTVRLRVTPTLGAAMEFTMAYSSGDQSLSTWNVTIPALPAGLLSISARAQLP